MRALGQPQPDPEHRLLIGRLVHAPAQARTDRSSEDGIEKPAAELFRHDARVALQGNPFARPWSSDLDEEVFHLPVSKWRRKTHQLTLAGQGLLNPGLVVGPRPAEQQVQIVMPHRG